MDKCLNLKQLLAGPDTLLMPDAYDALSAKLIEYAGFIEFSPNSLVCFTKRVCKQTLNDMLEMV